MKRAWFFLPALTLACNGESSTAEGPKEDPNANADGDCMTDAEERTLGTDPKSPDTDKDTITDCDEIDLGTDPVLADTDADGLTDPQEVACVSNPLDPAEKCYACGWKHNDPGNLVATGKNDGNVIGNMQLLDQCLETLSLWDLAATPESPIPEPAEYHILFMTAAW
jgi:thrombospondin type 3 repeat protein